MATHFSICAWKISWTEEPGGLQSMGSQRVRHIERLSIHAKNFQNGIYSNGFIMKNGIHLIYFIEKSTLLVRLEL